VPETGKELLRRYLEDATAAEKSFETQLRNFAKEGDDEEVQAAFLTHANETRSHHERLARRLEELGGQPSSIKTALADLFSTAPKLSQAGHVQEERVTQNLIAAFSVETGECAMYEALANAAAAAGDPETESLAREIQVQERETAERFFRFIPSRSKIAFNVLTPNEIDPAIETRAPDDRVI
jgi:ferritin-like metal-binding protein YciE